MEKTPIIPAEGKAQEDFFWTYTEEPHRTRRQAIIKAHPEVRQHLFAHFRALTHQPSRS